jgi:hypothetical protein
VGRGSAMDLRHASQMRSGRTGSESDSQVM